MTTFLRSTRWVALCIQINLFESQLVTTSPFPLRCNRRQCVCVTGLLAGPAMSLRASILQQQVAISMTLAPSNGSPSARSELFPTTPVVWGVPGSLGVAWQIPQMGRLVTWADNRQAMHSSMVRRPAASRASPVGGHTRPPLQQQEHNQNHPLLLSESQDLWRHISLSLVVFDEKQLKTHFRFLVEEDTSCCGSEPCDGGGCAHLSPVSFSCDCSNVFLSDCVSVKLVGTTSTHEPCSS